TIDYLFLQKEQQLDKSSERKFFFILLGVSAGSLFKPIFSSARIEILISLLIEIGELFCYLFILERTAGVIAVALTSFAIELFCHIITLFLIETESTKKAIADKLSKFILRLFFIVGVNFYSLLTLFLSHESRFRQTLFEISMIFSIFMAGIKLNLKLEVKPVEKPFDKKSITELKKDTESASIRPNITLALGLVRCCLAF
ncbi:unnamed protein product, partial [Adineta ricciae]